MSYADKIIYLLDCKVGPWYNINSEVEANAKNISRH